MPKSSPKYEAPKRESKNDMLKRHERERFVMKDDNNRRLMNLCYEQQFELVKLDYDEAERKAGL